MLQELDKGVGAILATLKQEGLDKNTLVIFTSDNGPMPFASQGPLRGKKGSIYEGGHRVPGIAWWPGNIEPDSTTEQTAISIDLVPTMLDYASVSTPVNHQLDGLSLRPIFNQKPLAKRYLYWRNGGLGGSSKKLESKGSPLAIRDGKWKLVAQAHYKKIELFDLSKDLGESTDLSAQFPEKTEQLPEALKTWEKAIIPDLPYIILPPE